MQKYTIKKGTTSKILMIDIYDSSSTTGARLAGLVFNSAGLTVYYNREGAAGTATAIVLATAIKGTWATGGFIAIDATNMPGYYELHIPDAALATGANSVLVELKGATNMVPKTILIELVDNVEADTYAIVNHTTYGNSALNTDLDTLITRVPAEVAQKGHLVNGTGNISPPVNTGLWDRIDAAISSRHVSGAAVASVTGAVGSVTAGVTVTTNNDKTGYVLSAAGVQAIWDALTSAFITVGSIGKKLADWVLGTDNKVILSNNAHTGAAIPTVTAITNDVGITQAGADKVWLTTTRTLTSFGALVSDIWANATRTLTGFSTTLAVSVWDVLETAIATASSIGLKIKTNLDNTISSRQPSLMTITGQAQGGSATSLILQADAHLSNDYYRGSLLVLDSGTGGGQGRIMISYNGITKVATVDRDWAIVPDATTLYSVYKWGDRQKIDNLDTTVSSRSSHTAADVWSVTTRTLTSFGTLVSDMWSYSSRTLTAFSTTLAVTIWDVLEAAILTASSIGLKLKNNLDTTVSSRLATSGYTAPDNASITAIKAKTDTIVWGDITDIKDGMLGKWSINKTTNVLIMYKADGVTVLKQFNLTDNASVSERVPV